MPNNYKQLEKIRHKISGRAHEARVLFERIYEYEQNKDIMILSKLGRRICKNIQKSCSDFEEITENL